ncbi:hypothetical protein HYPSUDRAFT_391755 [Hypholoma sublateritium FD-334 SS-4]|uniref:Uncharacterized protein n=1 Tax=Hypholoma sublateritium (strain FD-334 SS-4) TaxID=945553 RepID=A0A0D2LWT7_HYPSF|nr:hypothetical protein HYPSUDRAFT_391755 [Hypholoma sublateritium FD-334 SS-4]
MRTARCSGHQVYAVTIARRVQHLCHDRSFPQGIAISTTRDNAFVATLCAKSARALIGHRCVKFPRFRPSSRYHQRGFSIYTYTVPLGRWLRPHLFMLSGLPCSISPRSDFPALPLVLRRALRVTNCSSLASTFGIPRSRVWIEWGQIAQA